MKMINKQKEFIKSVYSTSNKPKVNQRVDLEEGFVVKGITFSENEYYVVIVGEK